MMSTQELCSTTTGYGKPAATPGLPAMPLAVVVLAAMYLIWGSTDLAIRVAVETRPPMSMTAVRALVAGATLLVWGCPRHRERPARAQWAVASVVGALLFCGRHGTLACAERRVASGVAALFLATIPLWMGLVQAITGGRRALGGRTLAGLAGGLCGIVLLVGPGETLGLRAINPTDVALPMLGAISWTVGFRLAQAGTRPLSRTTTTGMYLVTGGLLLVLVASIDGEWTRLAPAAVSTDAFVNPVIAIGLGWTIGEQSISTGLLLAALLATAEILTHSDRSAHRDLEIRGNSAGLNHATPAPPGETSMLARTWHAKSSRSRPETCPDGRQHPDEAGVRTPPDLRMVERTTTPDAPPAVARAGGQAAERRGAVRAGIHRADAVFRGLPGGQPSSPWAGGTGGIRFFPPIDMGG